MKLDIRIALFPIDEEAVLTIWREYIGATKSDLSYQNNDVDFEAISEKYSIPDGCVLLAHDGDLLIGCVGFRRHDKSICEMKRLYVRPEGRGVGVGRRLVERMVCVAKELGFAEMRLDVLAEFAHAQCLYASLGFRQAPSIGFNPIIGTQFLGLKL